MILDYLEPNSIVKILTLKQTRKKRGQNNVKMEGGDTWNNRLCPSSELLWNIFQNLQMEVFKNLN